MPNDSYPNNCYDNETINLLLNKEHTTWNLIDSTGKVLQIIEKIQLLILLQLHIMKSRQLLA